MSEFVVPVHRRNKETNQSHPLHNSWPHSVQLSLSLESWTGEMVRAQQSCQPVKDNTGDSAQSGRARSKRKSPSAMTQNCFSFSSLHEFILYVEKLPSGWQRHATDETRGHCERVSKAWGREPFPGRDYIDDNVALANVPKLHPFGWLYKGGY